MRVRSYSSSRLRMPRASTTEYAPSTLSHASAETMRQQQLPTEVHVAVRGSPVSIDISPDEIVGE